MKPSQVAITKVMGQVQLRGIDQNNYMICCQECRFALAWLIHHEKVVKHPTNGKWVQNHDC